MFDTPPPTPTPLEFEILLALAAGPLHGYGIIQDIESRGRAASHLRSGTLYLALRRLRDAGLVEPTTAPASEAGSTDARRKYFALTPRGGRAVADEVARLGRLVDVGRRRLADAGGTP
ncbi:PadR family transcriptional regulator [Gaopeijia maritima]|uniref:Helix-turn-helix transcriptional regulator n=1 Tax=Gaopeijia maritima TaxID=3119007 RepID=A0ABU9E8S6_9BACT